MAFEPGGMAEKLGNRYEGRWVAKQLLRLLNEKIKSVTVELIGPDEQGVDLLVVNKDGNPQLQQCKARCKSSEYWSISALKGILDNLKDHLSRDRNNEFALVTAIPAQTFADIRESSKNSNDNPGDFFQYQKGQDVVVHGAARKGIVHDGPLHGPGFHLPELVPFGTGIPHAGNPLVTSKHDAAVSVVPRVVLVLPQHRKLHPVDGLQFLQRKSQGHGHPWQYCRTTAEPARLHPR
jgi:hypothetical protein